MSTRIIGTRITGHMHGRVHAYHIGVCGVSFNKGKKSSTNKQTSKQNKQKTKTKTKLKEMAYFLKTKEARSKLLVLKRKSFLPNLINLKAFFLQQFLI